MKLYRFSFRALAFISAGVILLGGIPSAVSADAVPPNGESLITENVTMGLPPEISLQPAYLIRTFETNQQSWIYNSPDPSGIDYNPATGELIIVDSEVDEIGTPRSKPNVFMATTGGVLISVKNSYRFTTEASGVAINPNNQRIFIADDDNKKIIELNPGPDGYFWTEDDVWAVQVVLTDAEDLAYSNNQIFIAGGTDNEVKVLDLGVDGELTSDDFIIRTFDTFAYGFSDVEGITYNEATGTLFLISTAASENYLGEFSLTGELLNAWSLDFMGSAANIRSGLTLAPSSQDRSINNIYIVSRGIDNNDVVDPVTMDDDGKVWEISLVEPTPPPPDYLVFLPLVVK